MSEPSDRPPTTPDVQIARAVINNLYGRSGFDWWWDGIDEETRREIVADLAGEVRAHLSGLVRFSVDLLDELRSKQSADGNPDDGDSLSSP